MNMNCQEIRPLLGPYLDSELDTKTTLAISLHLKQCAGCAAQYDDESAWHNHLQTALSQGTKTEAVWDQVERQIAKPTPGSPAETAATVSSHIHSQPSAAANWRFWLWPSPRFYAGLAAVWFMILTIHVGTRETAPVAALTSPALRTALVEQRQLLAELLEMRHPKPEQPGGPAPQSSTSRPLGHSRV